MLALASPVSAGTSPEVPRNPLAAQISTRGIADQGDVPPTTAVAAVGAPSGNVSLSTEAHTAVAATASFNVDAGAIGKHRANIAERGPAAAPRRTGLLLGYRDESAPA